MKDNKIYKEKSVDKMLKVATLGIIAYAIYKVKDQRTLDALAVSIVGIILLINYGPKRDYYLPFLGDTVIPSGLLIPHFPENANFSKQLQIKPRQKIIFWASEPSHKPSQMPWEAYKEYKNSGVAVANERGIVTLRVRKPGVYSKPWGYGDSTLKRHIHYRVVRTNGMLGRVETVYV